MYPRRTFILTMEFSVPRISDRLFYFIQRAMQWELEYIGHLMGLDLKAGYHSILEVPQDWEEITVPVEAVDRKLAV